MTTTVMQLLATVKNPQRKPAAKYDWHDTDFQPGLYIVEQCKPESAALREVLGEEKYNEVLESLPTRVYITKVGNPQNRLYLHRSIDESHQGINALLLALQPIPDTSERKLDVLLIEAGVQYESYALEILRALYWVGKLTVADIQWAAHKVQDG